MSSTEAKVIVEVNGLQIKENSLYKIVDKVDRNALDGLKEYGSTKIPSNDAGNYVTCRFVNNLYDTGFYTNSPCYAGMDLTQKTAIVQKLQEKIVAPYESLFGMSKLDNTNFEFWDEFQYALVSNRIYNTANPQDLLELYLAMRGFELTPRGLDGDPRFLLSQFIIEDRDVTNKRKNVRAHNYMKAMQNYTLLMSTEKARLIAALQYARMRGADSFNTETSSEVIDSMFFDWINEDVNNVEDFLRVAELVNAKGTLEEVMIFSYLLKLNTKGKVKKIGENFFYQEEEIGIDLKSAAKNLAKNKSFKDTKNSVILEFEHINE